MTKYQVAGSSEVVVKTNSHRMGNWGEKGGVCPSLRGRGDNKNKLNAEKNVLK